MNRLLFINCMKCATWFIFSSFRDRYSPIYPPPFFFGGFSTRYFLNITVDLHEKCFAVNAVMVFNYYFGPDLANPPFIYSRVFFPLHHWVPWTLVWRRCSSFRSHQGWIRELKIVVVLLACSSPGAERDILHKHKVQTVPDTKRVSVDGQEHNVGSLLHSLDLVIDWQNVFSCTFHAQTWCSERGACVRACPKLLSCVSCRLCVQGWQICSALTKNRWFAYCH